MGVVACQHFELHFGISSFLSSFHFPLAFIQYTFTSSTPSPHLHHIFAISSPHLRHIFTTSSPHLRHIFATSSPHLRHIFATSSPHLRHIFATSSPHLHHITFCHPCFTTLPFAILASPHYLRRFTTLTPPH
jgi:hypothetical protein